MARKKRVSWLTSQREKLRQSRRDKADRQEIEFHKRLQDNPPASGSRYQTSRSSLRGSVYQNPRTNWTFREWVDELFEEGYDLSEYTWEGLYETYVNEEASYILENCSTDDILELIEAKDIPQEVALRIADMLKSAPVRSPQADVARKLRLYAVARNKKRMEKMSQQESYEAIVEYLFVEGYTDTIEAAEVMAESISDSWAYEILEDSGKNWEMVRRSASVRRDNITPIRVGKTPILKSTDVKPVDPEVAARRAKRGKMTLPEIL